ncbi:hypothetical protein [Klenkia brasiliensis]|uniref:Uncharacterized protein n=1 Tax=Klenkia brasiliensis TaxID=333142 RepID=A0A1G7MR79_9ACTN|nr:hypothetical protein [Klenkia brasiliensis]SDF64156.1 hypothetical protein SAMN05660324_0751 [Klenkia brasiliensis]
MIVLILAAWVLGGLLLALAIGGAVRVAEARRGWADDDAVVEPEVLTAA